MPFVKTNPRAASGFFEAEAAGLAWLAEAESYGGARTVRVESFSAGRIELEQLESTRPTPDAAVRFGRALAVTHGAGAQAFGAAPDGWDGPTFIGARPMMASRPGASTAICGTAT